MIKSIVIAFMICSAFNSYHLPDVIHGEWKIGKPYYGMGQPIGLDDKQEKLIIGLVIKFSQNYINICGKDIAIKSVETEKLTSDDFLEKYHFDLDRIGFINTDVLDIVINGYSTTKACGEFADPGTHLLIGKKHIVVEVGNDFFPLLRTH